MGKKEKGKSSFALMSVKLHRGRKEGRGRVHGGGGKKGGYCSIVLKGGKRRKNRRRMNQRARRKGSGEFPKEGGRISP